MNAVGLTNPGAKEFAQKLAKIKIPEDRFLLISIFGSDADEFKKVAEILLDDEVVWSSSDSEAQQTISIDVSNYTGTKTLKFRLRRTE